MNIINRNRQMIGKVLTLLLLLNIILVPNNSYADTEKTTEDYGVFIIKDTVSLWDKVSQDNILYSKTKLDGGNNSIYTFLSGRHRDISLNEILRKEGAKSYTVLSRENVIKIEENKDGQHMLKLREDKVASMEPIAISIDNSDVIFIRFSTPYLLENGYTMTTDSKLFEKDMYTEDKEISIIEDSIRYVTVRQNAIIQNTKGNVEVYDLKSKTSDIFPTKIEMDYEQAFPIFPTMKTNVGLFGMSAVSGSFGDLFKNPDHEVLSTDNYKDKKEEPKKEEEKQTENKPKQETSGNNNPPKLGERDNGNQSGNIKPPVNNNTGDTKPPVNNNTGSNNIKPSTDKNIGSNKNTGTKITVNGKPNMSGGEVQGPTPGRDMVYGVTGKSSQQEIEKLTMFELKNLAPFAKVYNWENSEMINNVYYTFLDMLTSDEVSLLNGNKQESVDRDGATDGWFYDKTGTNNNLDTQDKVQELSKCANLGLTQAKAYLCAEVGYENYIKEENIMKEESDAGNTPIGNVTGTGSGWKEPGYGDKDDLSTDFGNNGGHITGSGSGGSFDWSTSNRLTDPPKNLNGGTGDQAGGFTEDKPRNPKKGYYDDKGKWIVNKEEVNKPEMGNIELGKYDDAEVIFGDTGGLIEDIVLKELIATGFDYQVYDENMNPINPSSIPVIDLKIEPITFIEYDVVDSQQKLLIYYLLLLVMATITVVYFIIKSRDLRDLKRKETFKEGLILRKEEIKFTNMSDKDLKL